MLWRDRIVIATGTHRCYNPHEWLKFVRDEVPDGLGLPSTEPLKELAGDDAGLLGLLRQLETRERGGDRRSLDFKDDNIIFETATKPEQGTSAAYAITRLAKARPDLHQRVIAGELSPHAAAVQAGFRRKRCCTASSTGG